MRLIDDGVADPGDSTLTLGADIDAVGAISTVVVPPPAAAWLLLSGLALFVPLSRRREASPV